VLESAEARAVVTEGARRAWEALVSFYDLAMPEEVATDAKSRVLRAMQEHARVGGQAPVCVLFCVLPQAGAGDLQQGGSIYPALQNFLLAARAQGLGAAVTLWHDLCEADLRLTVGIPPEWRIASLVTAGWPRGGHRPVRRKPVTEVVVCDRWDHPWQ
jgi:nitroreductase